MSDQEEEPYVPKQRKNFTEIVPYKVFIVICLVLAVLAVLDIVIEQVPLNLFRGILIVELFALLISLYYMLDFIKNKWYPNLLKVLHVPNKIKKIVDDKIFGLPFVIMSTALVGGVIVLIILIGRAFFMAVLSTFTLYVLFDVTFGLTAWLVIENMAFVFSGIYYVIYYRHELIFKPGHEDGMGGSKVVLESFFKNIYPMFICIIIAVTLMIHFITGGWGFFGIQVPFQLQVIMASIVGIGIIVIFSGVFVPQLINHVEMSRFKKNRIKILREELKIFKQELKKSVKGSPQEMYVPSKVMAIMLDLEDIREMKSILIDSSLLKKLFISLIGFLISYILNLIFQGFFVV